MLTLMVAERMQEIEQSIPRRATRHRPAAPARRITSARLWQPTPTGPAEWCLRAH